MLPLDEDVLSFELDLAFRVSLIENVDVLLSSLQDCYNFYTFKLLLLFTLQECQVDGDTSSLWHVAKAIHKLEVFILVPIFL